MYILTKTQMEGNTLLLKTAYQTRKNISITIHKSETLQRKQIKQLQKIKVSMKPPPRGNFSCTIATPHPEVILVVFAHPLRKAMFASSKSAI